MINIYFKKELLISFVQPSKGLNKI